MQVFSTLLSHLSISLCNLIVISESDSSLVAMEARHLPYNCVNSSLPRLVDMYMCSVWSRVYSSSVC